MELLRIDRRWPLAPAEQLKAQLRVAIRAGELPPGSRVPKVRALAAEVGLNANTVAAAYRDLAREGLLTARRRGGTHVAAGPFFPSRAETVLLGDTDNLAASARRMGMDGADLIRLVAGRWLAKPGTGSLSAEPGAGVYDFIRSRDHDEG